MLTIWLPAVSVFKQIGNGVVTRPGLEPGTPCLKGRSSAN